MSRQTLPSHLHFPTTEKKWISFISLKNNKNQIRPYSSKPLWNKKKPPNKTENGMIDLKWKLKTKT